MPNDRLLGFLGLARKAGKLAVGTAATEESIKRKRAKLVIIASDISAKSEKEIRFLCDKFGATAATAKLGIDDITQSIGTRAGILAVEDEGFAKAMAENL